MKLTAYEIHATDNDRIEPAPRTRAWMDETPQRFAYRCLPMVIANQFGWEILSRHCVRAAWTGEGTRESIAIDLPDGGAGSLASSHFGCGVLTFSVPWLFCTEPGWNLLVRGPANAPKDGIAPLEGIVEADHAHATFTMNWKFTRPCVVEFAAGEPIGLIQPVQRGILERFDPTIEPLSADPDLRKRHNNWSVERTGFNAGLEQQDAGALRQGWQKDYFKAAIETKVGIPAFRNRLPR